MRSFRILDKHATAVTSVGELEGSYCPHDRIYTFFLRFVGYINCYRHFQLTKRHTAIFSTQMAPIYQYLSPSFREIYPDIFITVVKLSFFLSYTA
jgi:hypothetical protein